MYQYPFTWRIIPFSKFFWLDTPTVNPTQPPPPFVPENQPPCPIRPWSAWRWRRRYHRHVSSSNCRYRCPVSCGKSWSGTPLKFDPSPKKWHKHLFALKKRGGILFSHWNWNIPFFLKFCWCLFDAIRLHLPRVMNHTSYLIGCGVLVVAATASR